MAASRGGRGGAVVLQRFGGTLDDDKKVHLPAIVRPPSTPREEKVADDVQQVPQQQLQNRHQRLDARLAAQRAHYAAQGEVVRVGILSEEIAWTEAVQLKKIAEQKKRAKLEQEAAVRAALEREWAEAQAKARQEHAALLAEAAERDRMNFETSSMEAEDEASERLRTFLREEAERACMEAEDTYSRIAMVFETEREWNEQVLRMRQHVDEERNDLAREHEAMQHEEELSRCCREEARQVRLEFASSLAMRTIEAAVSKEAMKQFQMKEEHVVAEYEVRLEQAEREAMASEDLLSRRREEHDREAAQSTEWEVALARQRAAIREQRASETVAQQRDREQMLREDALSSAFRTFDTAARLAAKEEQALAIVTVVARISARCALRAESHLAFQKRRVLEQQQALASEHAAMLVEDELSQQLRAQTAEDERRRRASWEWQQMQLEDRRSHAVRESEQRRRRQEEREFVLRKADHYKKRQEVETLRMQQVAAQERAKAARAALATQSASQEAAAREVAAEQALHQQRLQEEAKQAQAAREAARRKKLLNEDKDTFEQLYSKNRSQVAALRSMEQQRLEEELEKEARERAATAAQPDDDHVQQSEPKTPAEPRPAYRRPRSGQGGSMPPCSSSAAAAAADREGDSAAASSATASRDAEGGASRRVAAEEEGLASPPRAIVTASPPLVWWHGGSPLDVASLIHPANLNELPPDDDDAGEADADLDAVGGGTFFTEG